jgi:2'-5' RNA ligase
MSGGAPEAQPPRVRLFVALDLPESARAALAAWRDELLGGRPELRLVQSRYLHVTMAFLGWRAEADVERVAAAALGSAASFAPPRLEPRALRLVPPRQPRVIALDLGDEDGGAAALQGAIVEALQSERLFRPERRPFWPHLTLARVRRGARVQALPERSPPHEPFQATALTLYRSTLRPDGAVYDALARVALGGG